MSIYDSSVFSELSKDWSTVSLTVKFLLQLSALCNVAIGCCCFRAIGFQFPVVLEPPFYRKKFANEKKTQEGMILEHNSIS